MKSKSIEDTHEIARQFLELLIPTKGEATVIGLVGDLGSGKTAFVKELASILGVGEDITSPTFVIEKRYGITHKDFDNLIHIDAYRLESEHEILKLGWNFLVRDARNLIVVEWPEVLKKILPASTRFIHFTFVDATTRDISYEQ